MGVHGGACKELLISRDALRTLTSDEYQQVKMKVYYKFCGFSISGCQMSGSGS